MNEELDLKEIIKCTYQKRKVLAYILIASLLIGMLYTFIIKRPIYEINAKILIDRSDASIEDFVVSKDVLKNENINVVFDKTSKTIDISISCSKKKIDESFKEIKSYIENLETKLQETYSVKTYKMLQTPQVPEKASNVTYLKDIGMSIVIAIVLYGGYIMIMISTRGIVSASEIEKGLNMNLLGKIDLEKTEDKNKIVYNVRNNKIKEQLKRIQVNLELNKENKRPKTILITGTSKNTGTTFTTKNLAEQYSKLYEKVLIIDADINKQRLSNILLENKEQGLTEIVLKNKIEEIEKNIIKLNIDNLYLLPSGIEKIEEELFLKDNISKILEKLKKEFDIILIDTMSINESIVPIVLSSIVDATVIVAEREKTKAEDILKAKTLIENVNGKISGVILNKMI